MSADIDIRLAGPLNKIVRLAIDRAQLCRDEDLDLFDLRNLIGQKSKEAIIAYLRSEAERLSGNRQTIRGISRSLIKGLMGLNNVYCVVCPITTPEGEVTTRLGDTHVFAVSGSVTGYIPLSYK